ncbi:CoA transferase [Nocardioides sp. NBC_00850]|uniref:CoA transferase n=1 Tax=Nocardioides sp. NBC_00850 TaxID=2976001 RepID=UPI00386C90F5|nr:CoA transferase [Nocardioides sp. NBC_00850]
MTGTSAAPLRGVRVVEAATFVAGPFAGMVMSQLGADVIRVDPPGGGSDFGRWPLAATGASLFWANLNRAKRSVTIDHRQPEGRELLLELICAPGPAGGVFVDNMVGGRRIKHEDLAARRSDVIHVHIEGRRDGKPAVDYSINAEVGVPLMTGPSDAAVPINHVLPAWDLVTGMLATTAVSAALLQRDRTGEGSYVEVALADVALAGVAGMGWVAEAGESGSARDRMGNHMFGSFGVDFETSDRRRVMVVALTEGQWKSLRKVTGTEAVFEALENTVGADLDNEGDRFRLRETIASILRPWFASRDYATVKGLLDEAKVLWSPYRDMAEVVETELSDPASIIEEIEQPGVGPMLSAASPWRWGGEQTRPTPAPSMSADTDDVLSELLGLSQRDLGRLRDARIIG